MRTLILMCFLSLCYCIAGIGRMQAVGAKGKLLCNGEPAAGVIIKLYEMEIWFDRKLDEAITDSTGSFTVSGYAKEVTDIDPQVHIYHRCKWKWPNWPCYHMFTIKIPDTHIANGKIVKQYFIINNLELAKIQLQMIDCLN